MNTSSLWMAHRRFDLLFFSLSGLVFLLLLLPYHWWGPAVVFPIYNFYLVFFGLPHNYLTWATVLPTSARKSFKLDPIITAAIVCALISLLIPITRGHGLNDWILSFISYYSLWHAYRQHHGLCKIYDSIQAKRTGDTRIFIDRRWLNLFFGLGSFAVVVWAFTAPRIDYLLSSEESYQLIYPPIPSSLFYAYCIITAAVGLIGLKFSVWDRWRRGAFIPWPQLSLMTVALLTYIVPYYFIPLTAMPLAVAIATMYHNVQYFAFVWLFQKYHAHELQSLGLPLQTPLRLAFSGSWKKYFTVALAYSFLVVAFYKLVPNQVGLTFIYFLGLSHYVIDGYVWRRDVNSAIGGFTSYLADPEKLAMTMSPSGFASMAARTSPVAAGSSARTPADLSL
jgi:hypothetical protein